MTDTVHLSEVFGPTFQGEGPHAGRVVGFVRLGLCNLTCEWCDTPYTWDRSRFDLTVEAPLTPVPDVLAQVAALGVDTVVVSGGEPLIHHHTLRPLLDPRYTWHVETNGTIAPPAWWGGRVAHTSVSPKINTRDPERRRLRGPALDAWAALGATGASVAYKFVASTVDDLDAVDKVVRDHGLPRADVWVMPEGTTAFGLIARHQALAARILDHGWNTTTRLHVLLWGDERGR